MEVDAVAEAATGWRDPASPMETLLGGGDGNGGGISVATCDPATSSAAGGLSQEAGECSGERVGAVVLGSGGVF